MMTTTDFNFDDYFLKNFSHMEFVAEPNNDDDHMLLKPKQSSPRRGGGSSKFRKAAANYFENRRPFSESEPSTINSHFQNLLANATRRYEPTDKLGDEYRPKTDRHEKQQRDIRNRNNSTQDRNHKESTRKLTHSQKSQ